MKLISWSGFYLGLLVLMAGCSSTPKVDWDTRIGNFTYDQAVLEIGPPDRESKLTDGARVGEWLVSRLRSPDYVMGGGYGWRSGWYGSGWGGYVQSGQYYETFLRLTFGADGKLQAWKKVTR